MCPFPASSLCARIYSRRKTAGGFFHHDPFLVVGIELVHEESWKIYMYVDRLSGRWRCWALTITVSEFIMRMLYTSWRSYFSCIGYEKSSSSSGYGSSSCWLALLETVSLTSSSAG